jgi:hypothetical protein
MTDVKLKEIYPVPEDFRKNAYVNSYDQYKKMWQDSIDDPDGFWGKVADEQVSWFKKWDKVADFNYGTNADDLYIPMVHQRQAERFLQLPRPAPGHPGRSDRLSSGKATIPMRKQKIHLQGASCRGL